MREGEERWQRLIEGLRAGEEQVVREFCEQYGPQLEQLADQHLPQGLRGRLGPEDIVQSAYRTFLRRARAGEFHLADSAALWRLLCAITLTKVREQVRFHRRQRRSYEKEVLLPDLAGEREEEAEGGFEPLATGPSPAEALARLRHPHIVQIHEVGEDRGRPYLVLEYVAGGTLAERLGGAPQPARAGAAVSRPWPPPWWDPCWQSSPWRRSASGR